MLRRSDCLCNVMYTNAQRDVKVNVQGWFGYQYLACSRILESARWPPAVLAICDRICDLARAGLVFRGLALPDVQDLHQVHGRQARGFLQDAFALPRFVAQLSW